MYIVSLYLFSNRTKPPSRITSFSLFSSHPFHSYRFCRYTTQTYVVHVNCMVNMCSRLSSICMLIKPGNSRFLSCVIVILISMNKFIYLVGLYLFLFKEIYRLHTRCRGTRNTFPEDDIQEQNVIWWKFSPLSWNLHILYFRIISWYFVF